MIFFPLPGIFFRHTSDVHEIKNRSSKLEHHLVDVTPTPVFSGLKRLDNWVVSRVKVFGGMLVLGRIAAANMPAFETEAQVYPRISGF